MNNTPTATTPPATTGFDEPWQVRPHDLQEGPFTCTDGTRFQHWDIIGNSSPHCLCETGWTDRPVNWGYMGDSDRAVAIRDRIITCVNACAGMEDPTTEIPALRARIADLEAEVTTLNRIADSAQRLVDKFGSTTTTPTPTP